MHNKTMFAASLLMGLAALGTNAQEITFHGVKNTMRYDDGDDTKYEYLGWNSETQTAEFLGDVGLWKLYATGSSVSSELEHYDNLLYGNSGAIYVNGKIYTVFSHEDPDATQDGVMEFIVRKWDATTFEMLSSQRFKKEANLESRGMAYNPVDGKVYGLFYLTDVALPVPEDQLPEEDRQEGLTTDAGYAICTIDLETMQLTQITPGIYYDNFVTLACSPDGRLFSMTSGGTMVEFDAATGLMLTRTATASDGSPVQVNLYEHSGVQSQFKRQAACFDHNTGKMYWNGYVNSGMGINDNGSWAPLSDREWRTNGKYDTALYEVDIQTGAATRIDLIPNRIAFSCLWVEGADGTSAIDNVRQEQTQNVELYNLSGQSISPAAAKQQGTFIYRNGKESKVILLR